MKLEVIEVERSKADLSDEQQNALQWLENKFFEWSQNIEAENKLYSTDNNLLSDEIN